MTWKEPRVTPEQGGEEGGVEGRRSVCRAAVRGRRGGRPALGRSGVVGAVGVSVSGEVGAAHGRSRRPR